MSVATILGPVRWKSRPGQWTQKWETSGTEGHLDRQAAARGALGGGGVGEVGDVAQLVEEDQA